MTDAEKIRLLRDAPEPDLASILGDLTNLIQNERVKSYNEGFDAAKSASASAPAEPNEDLECPACGTKMVTEASLLKKLDAANEAAEAEAKKRGYKLHPRLAAKSAPPDTEAWKRVPVDAGMAVKVLRARARVRGKDQDALWALAGEIQRAAQKKVASNDANAKLVEE